MSTKNVPVTIVSSERGRKPLVAAAIILVLLLVTLTGCASSASSVLTHNLSEPLGTVDTAKIEIDPGDGNLTVDQQVSSEQELASGTLEYLENQGQPIRTMDTSGGQAVLTLKGSSGKQSGFRLPWADCNGATTWQVHLNPKVTSDLTARTGGGNVKLNLASIAVTRLLADTGGGNMEVVLPEKTANLNAAVKTGAGDVTLEIGSAVTGSSTVSANSGAGNVLVRLPGGIAARIHASAGMGKTLIDSQFSKIDDTTYQSADYDSAADKIEITVNSGAGNVTVETYESLGGL